MHWLNTPILNYCDSLWNGMIRTSDRICFALLISLCPAMRSNIPFRLLLQPDIAICWKNRIWFHWMESLSASSLRVSRITYITSLIDNLIYCYHQDHWSVYHYQTYTYVLDTMHAPVDDFMHYYYRTYTCPGPSARPGRRFTHSLRCIHLQIPRGRHAPSCHILTEVN